MTYQDLYELTEVERIKNELKALKKTQSGNGMTVEEIVKTWH